MYHVCVAWIKTESTTQQWKEREKKKLKNVLHMFSEQRQDAAYQEAELYFESSLFN